MILYRIALAIDLAIAAGVVFFFVWGLTDGSVSSFNASLWAGILAVVIAVPAAGWILHNKGQRKAALALLSVLAMPGLLGALFMLALIVLNPRWN